MQLKIKSHKQVVIDGVYRTKESTFDFDSERKRKIITSRKILKEKYNGK